MEGQVWLTSRVCWGLVPALCFASHSYADRGRVVAKQHVPERAMQKEQT